jgi:hypothetical protein
MSDKVEEGQEVQPKEEAKALEWKPWHDALPPEAQELVAEREKGLKSALDSERDARKTAETDLRAVAKKLEEGSEAQQEVLKLADQVAEGTTKADFYEEAHKAGVSNLKLAYHVATTEELFDKRGAVNFEKMKEAYPELFGKKQVPRGDAGEGTGTAPGGKDISMNAFIRRSAGKQ